MKNGEKMRIKCVCRRRMLGKSLVKLITGTVRGFKSYFIALKEFSSRFAFEWQPFSSANEHAESSSVVETTDSNISSK